MIMGFAFPRFAATNFSPRARIPGSPRAAMQRAAEAMKKPAPGKRFYRTNSDHSGDDREGRPTIPGGAQGKHEVFSPPPEEFATRDEPLGGLFGESGGSAWWRYFLETDSARGLHRNQRPERIPHDSVIG